MAAKHDNLLGMQAACDFGNEIAGLDHGEVLGLHVQRQHNVHSTLLHSVQKISVFCSNAGSRNLFDAISVGLDASVRCAQRVLRQAADERGDAAHFGRLGRAVVPVLDHLTVAVVTASARPVASIVVHDDFADGFGGARPKLVEGVHEQDACVDGRATGADR